MAALVDSTYAVAGSAVGLIGTTIDMPNSEWGQQYDDGRSTEAEVLGFVAGGCEDGTDAYICRAEGHNYIFAARVVRYTYELEC